MRKLLLSGACLLLPATLFADEPAWNSIEMVFVGKLDKVQRGPVGMSFPPMHTATLSFTVERAIRGNLKPGTKLQLGHALRQEMTPAYPEGQRCLVGAATGAHNQRELIRLEEADAASIEAVSASCRLPLGWKLVAGRPASPWQEAWPKAAGNFGASILCAKTGRPALLCGDAIQFDVKPVPPKKEIQWTNPDGDGEYQFTVTNKSDKPQSVPALLTDGKDILWANSLVILCQDKAYPAPGYRTGLAQLQPVELKPGASVTGIINALALEGPEWPQGGYRITLQFCLGEKSASHSFYYMARHHDKIREALRQKH